jgi:hypothetical protein
LRVLRSLMRVLSPRKVETVKSGIIVPDYLYRSFCNGRGHVTKSWIISFLPSPWI